jgi:hypothetical protein
MANVLDNPAWNALISGNKNFANGRGPVRFFDKEVSPFAALEENTAENLQVLYKQIPHSGPIFICTPAELEILAPWKVIRVIQGFQMVHNGPAMPDEGKAGLIPLQNKHVPEMIALARLTNPGPFESRTIEFGHYHGIFEGGKLVAMAGQRLHAFNYAEVSAVCTHPGYTSKGYARQLLIGQVNRIKASSDPIFTRKERQRPRY